VDTTDLAVRRATYARFVELGRGPTADDTAEVTGLSVEGVIESWRRLHAMRALVLNPATDEIRMANPFSAVPTAYRVRAGGRWWYANCAWDALGICAALQAGGRIEASCPDCGELLSFDVEGERPSDESLLFHCLVPAARWWDDIVFT
jgi:Alkylmercury lyase